MRVSDTTKGASPHAGDGPKQGQLQRVASWEWRRGGRLSGSAGKSALGVLLCVLVADSCVSMRSYSVVRPRSLGRDGRVSTNVCGRWQNFAASRHKAQSKLRTAAQAEDGFGILSSNTKLARSVVGVLSNMQNRQQLHHELVLS